MKIYEAITFCVLIAASGCCREPKPAGYTDRSVDGVDALRSMASRRGVTEAEQQWIEDNCPEGLPQREGGWAGTGTSYVYRLGYVLEYSHADRIPIWVAERVTRDELRGSWTGRFGMAFIPDPALGGAQAAAGDYNAEGYDPGHLAAAANQNASADLKRATFFLSNNAPQAECLNRGLWLDVEKRVRRYAKRYGTVHVVSGTLLLDRGGGLPTPGDTIRHAYIGGNKVTVPTHFFKVIVWRERGKFHATTLNFANKPALDFRTLSEHAKSLQWLKDRCGLELFPGSRPDVVEVSGSEFVQRFK